MQNTPLLHIIIILHETILFINDFSCCFLWYFRVKWHRKEVDGMDALKNINPLLIIDIVSIGFGIYMLCICISMKRTGKIHSVLLTEPEIKKCRHPEKFIAYMNPRLLGFSIITLIDGVIGLADVLVISSRYLDFAYMIIFFAAFLWFTSTLKKAREKFC